MQKKRTGRMLCSLALSAVTLWGVSVTAPAKNARDALRSLKDETLGVMLLRYERGNGGEDFLSLRTSLALHATPLLREGEENIAQAWSAELEQSPMTARTKRATRRTARARCSRRRRRRTRSP